MITRPATNAAVVKPKRILIVEDEDNTRIALTKLLTREGFQVESVSNGCEALSFLHREQVNLIVTDIKMPHMDGIAFLRELNKNFPKSNVIMITAYGGVESYLEAMNLGAFEYLNKPLQIEELRLVMKKILESDSQ
jgi:two-component system, response regulator, stage 0 sporulation protein F